MTALSLSAVSLALRDLADNGVTPAALDRTERLLRDAALAHLSDVDDFLDMCASFRPGGGEFLYDEAAIASAAERLVGAVGVVEAPVPDGGLE